MINKCIESDTHSITFSSNILFLEITKDKKKIKKQIKKKIINIYDNF